MSEPQSTTYADFLASKSQIDNDAGFEPVWMPDFLYDFQQSLTDWAIRKGRSAIFAECGLGKTPMQLVWAENVIRHTNRPVLILTPLAVAPQTVREGEKFDIEVTRIPGGRRFSPPKAGVYATNYERLHFLDPADWAGVVCDESSAIKHFSGKRQQEVTEFMRTIAYRLLCTATAAPNDFIELGTSAEALGQLGRMDMLGTFFLNDENSNHPIWWGARWRFKKHAEIPFWRWVCSWARACRKPSDLGFDDARFILPPLEIEDHVVEATRPFDGMLFQVEARRLDEQREERKITMEDRCQKVAELVTAHDRPTVSWCHLNPEGDLLEKIIPGARQVKGAMRDEEKEEIFLAFAAGQLRHLVTKPQMGAFGLNWQHCADQTFYPSHSFEQWYQGIRRSWRFGQERTVHVDLVTTKGELGVMKNLQRKADQADKMFAELVGYMNEAMTLDRASGNGSASVEVPTWLS